MRQRAVWLLAVVAAGILSTSCASTQEPVRASPLPPRPASVRVTMADFYFVYPNRVPAGRVVFDVTNAGEVPHRLSLFRLPDDGISAADHLRTTAEPPAVPLQNMTILQPEDEGTFAVDLVPNGRYVMASLLVGPDGVNDAERGMIVEFRTRSQPWAWLLLADLLVSRNSSMA